MKQILAYTNSARPLRADEGQIFRNIRTDEAFIFHNGYWRPFVETPSTPEQVLSEPSTPKEEAEPEKPKKKTSKKSTPKKKEETK